MDINKLLNKLASQERALLETKIFAPYVKNGTNILLRINGTVYKLKTSKFKQDGFGIFRATDANHARRLRAANISEVSEYLQLLPKAEFILIHKHDRWLAYPANQHSFKQKFNKEPDLLTILMADNVEILDSIEARFDGFNFWYENTKIPENAEIREKLRESIITQEYKLPTNLDYSLLAEEAKSFKFACDFHREANKPPLEKQLNKEFEKVGASVDRYIERGTNVEVQWKDNHTKKTYTSVLNKDTFSVVTAGICLSGGDKKFDLQSLVSVCREGEQGHRIVHVGNGGMDEGNYWDTYDEYDDD